MSPKEAHKTLEVHGKRRRPVRRSISQPAKIPPNLVVRNILCDDKKPKLLHIGDFSVVPQGLPRCWSCPTISLYIRSHLKPPLKQQASFDENVYEVDVMRNVAAKQKLNEKIISPFDERRTSLPYLNVDGTQTKDKPIQLVISDESKLYRKSSDTAVKSLLSEINKSLDDEKISKEYTEPNTFKKSSSQKGILKKNSSDKSISFQHASENKLQRSLSGPYDKWQKGELTCAKQFDKYVFSKQNPDKINLCKTNRNVQNMDTQNDYFLQKNDHTNPVNIIEKGDLINENTLSFSNLKNVNDVMSKMKSISLNATANRCYSTNSSVTFSPKTDNTKNVGNEKALKKGFISTEKCSSSKDSKLFINAATDNERNLNSSFPHSQISRFNHARRSLTAVESVCLSDKRNVVDILDDHHPSRIPIRFTCPKNCDENNTLYGNKLASSEEASDQKSIMPADKRRPRSLIIWQNTNSFEDEGNANYFQQSFHGGVSDNKDCIVLPFTPEQSNTTEDSSTTNTTQHTDEKITVQRRRRADPDCKYVKDESELKLNFVRRRQRPTSITSLSRIPRPCNNKQYPDRNSCFFGNSTDNVHSVCHKSSVNADLNLQRVSSMPSVPLLSEKQLPIYFHGQKVEHTAINELPQPPPGDPPPNHCLPSRFVAAF